MLKVLQAPSFSFETCVYGIDKFESTDKPPRPAKIGKTNKLSYLKVIGDPASNFDLDGAILVPFGRPGRQLF
jgi:hypothetical protein